MMRLDYRTDGGGSRVRLGLILLHVDETIEGELGRLLGLDGVAVYGTRVRSGVELGAGSLQDMAARLPAAAALLPPSAALDVVAFACTSGASVIGADRVADLIRSARRLGGPASLARAVITDPLTAARAACRALGVRRLGVVSPYVAPVARALCRSLQDGGLDVAACGTFEQAEEPLVARIAPEAVLRAAMQVCESAPCDGVFVSCTNLRTLDVLAAAEQRLGVPVISSNQALAWHMLRSAGIGDRVDGFGALLRV